MVPPPPRGSLSQSREVYLYGDGNWVSAGARRPEQTPLIALSGICR